MPEMKAFSYVIPAVSIGKLSAASEGYVKHDLWHLGSIVEGWVNMS